jgi:hypothetical protein
MSEMGDMKFTTAGDMMREDIYTKEYVRERLLTDILRVTFDKVNGDRRIMTCTLQRKYLPASNTESNRPEPKDSLAVWDLNANGWRSFRIDKIVAIEEGVTYP